MVIITLIGEHLAKEGSVFVYRGPLTECRECKLKAVCFNLEQGGQYRIKATRDVKHECRMHEEGVRVVEVERLPVRVGVGQRYALEGSTITFEESRCRNLGCASYRVCHPVGVKRGTKCKVRSVLGDIECPEGAKVIEIEVE